MKLTDYKEEYDADRVLVMGLPKSGKSTLVAGLAEKFRLTWIDTEGGIKTLQKLPSAWQDNINLIRLPDSASYPIAAETLLLLFKAGKAKICHEHGKINCAICTKENPLNFTSVDFDSFTKQDILVLDTVSQLGLSLLAHLTRNKPTDYKLDRDDWGALKKYTEYFKSQFQALRCNFVCVSHILEAKDEAGVTKLYPSFGSGPMSTIFGGAFDHNVYIEQKNLKHVSGSMTNYSINVNTGSRTDFDITKMDKPSLIPLFDGSYQVNKVVALTPAQQAMSNLTGKK